MRIIISSPLVIIVLILFTGWGWLASISPFIFFAFLMSERGLALKELRVENYYFRHRMNSLVNHSRMSSQRSGTMMPKGSVGKLPF